jgi:hypothetical protein
VDYAECRWLGLCLPCRLVGLGLYLPCFGYGFLLVGLSELLGLLCPVCSLHHFGGILFGVWFYKDFFSSKKKKGNKVSNRQGQLFISFFAILSE